MPKKELQKVRAESSSNNKSYSEYINATFSVVIYKNT